MALSNNKAFSNAAHQISTDGQAIDWVTGPVNVVLLGNGVMDIHLKDQPPLTLDTRAGLLQANNTTTPLQWSNSDGEIEVFIDRARKTYAFGQPLTSDILDVRHNRSTDFIRVGDSAILISQQKDNSIGVAIFDEGKGIRSVQIDVAPVAAPATAPRRDMDNALTHASL